MQKINLSQKVCFPPFPPSLVSHRVKLPCHSLDLHRTLTITYAEHLPLGNLIICLYYSITHCWDSVIIHREQMAERLHNLGLSCPEIT